MASHYEGAVQCSLLVLSKRLVSELVAVHLAIFRPGARLTILS